MKFTMTIPVKPYVRRFIEMNYGSPADIAKDVELYQWLRGALRKQNKRYDSKYPEINYQDEIDILISEDDFYRYGWELSRTDNVAFNRKMEARAKNFMRIIIGGYIATGLKHKVAINKFQIQFGFNEDTWSAESIKKDFYRNAPKEVIDFSGEILSKIERIILENLSSLGTISRKAIKEYENG